MSTILRANTKPRALRGRGGFTLIEVMTSIFVFTIIMVIFTGTISTSRRAGSLNGQYAQATSLCQHKIDRMRSVGFGSLDHDSLVDRFIIDDDGNSTQPYSFTLTDGVADFLPEPTTGITVEYLDATTARVTVTVSWKKVSYEDRTSSMSLCALIANTE